MKGGNLEKKTPTIAKKGKPLLRILQRRKVKGLRERTRKKGEKTGSRRGRPLL